MEGIIQSVRERLANWIFLQTLVRERMVNDDEFLEKLVRDALGDMGFDIDGPSARKRKASTLSPPFPLALSPTPPVMDPEGHLPPPSSDCIKKLYSQGEFVGTIYMVEKKIAVTAFGNIVFGQEVLEASLSVAPEGYTLQHIISFPFYDISFYMVKGYNEHPYLDRGRMILSF